MKKILMVGLISSVFSAGAFAAACAATAAAVATGITAGGSAPTAGENCVCDGAGSVKATINGGAGTVVATPLYVKTGFDVMCSANTVVSYNEISGTAFAVASGSRKGNQSFTGSTAGGSVTTHLACTGANKACTGGDVTIANTAATAAAGS